MGGVVILSSGRQLWRGCTRRAPQVSLHQHLGAQRRHGLTSCRWGLRSFCSEKGWPQSPGLLLSLCIDALGDVMGPSVMAARAGAASAHSVLGLWACEMRAVQTVCWAVSGTLVFSV